MITAWFVGYTVGHRPERKECRVWRHYFAMGAAALAEFFDGVTSGREEIAGVGHSRWTTEAFNARCRELGAVDHETTGF